MTADLNHPLRPPDTVRTRHWVRTSGLPRRVDEASCPPRTQCAGGSRRVKTGEGQIRMVPLVPEKLQLRKFGQSRFNSFDSQLDALPGSGVADTQKPFSALAEIRAG